MARDTILHRVRTSLGRSAGQPVPAPPAEFLDVPVWTVEERITRFRAALEALGGVTHRAAGDADVALIVAELLAGRSAVASASPVLAECGVTAIAGVRSVFDTPAALRAALEHVDAGITGADYGLADTGSLVVFSGGEEARTVSLLPPIHIAVLRLERLLTGLDELMTLHAFPGERSSAMIVITGPSRTADIEMILVRGIHGPGTLHVILV